VIVADVQKVGSEFEGLVVNTQVKGWAVFIAYCHHSVFSLEQMLVIIMR